MNFIKKNFVVLLAFTLPVLLIVSVALSAYLPSLFFSTNYNFIYTTCDDGGGYCENYLQRRYSVVDGRLVMVDVDPNIDYNGDGEADSKKQHTTRVFIHNTNTDESREIPIDEASTLSLSSLLTSPDGVTLSGQYDRNSDFLLFGGSSSFGHYLTKGNSRIKLNLVNSTDSYYYQDNFRFIGWVMPGRN